ncbi:MAG: chemotaxis protein CheW [Lachnospiraceae bacterium]|nr:chemotaxis protein CheW [Lachnospiraceae bacterium]
MTDSTQIGFLIENQNYGIGIMDVRAVEKWENISPVLGAPDYIKGVLNLRGELIPVYSIRRKFCLPEREVDEATKLIIVNLPEMPVAIEVDSVVGIINVSEEKKTDRPRMLNTISTEFVGHVAEVNGKIILLIDLQHLIPQEERQTMVDMLETGKE